MRVMSFRNVNEAYARVVADAMEGTYWQRRESRNGAVLEHVSPFCSVYERPWERVLLNAERDANPFFHLMEGLWILGGRDDVAWISHFNKNIAQYSDDGVVFYGAYGRRLRGAKLRGESDQVEWAIQHLRRNPESRRCVLQIWDERYDRDESLDLPCNTHVYLKIRDEALHMTVCCRSNDVIWGCYGANAVHFSMLHEYLARGVGARQGNYVHISDSFHIYEDNPSWQKHLEDKKVSESAIYRHLELIESVPLVGDRMKFDEELTEFLSDDWFLLEYSEPFLDSVAMPMRLAWDARKKGGSYEDVMRCVRRIAATDWRLACSRWMQRRYDR